MDNQIAPCKCEYVLSGCLCGRLEYFCARPGCFYVRPRCQCARPGYRCVRRGYLCVRPGCFCARRGCLCVSRGCSCVRPGCFCVRPGCLCVSREEGVFDKMSVWGSGIGETAVPRRYRRCSQMNHILQFLRILREMPISLHLTPPNTSSHTHPFASGGTEV